MKKWFEYQLEHQVVSHEWSQYSTPVTNLNKHLAKVFISIKQNHQAGKYQIYLKKYFTDQNYHENATDGIDLTVEQMESYINDPDYAELIAGNSVDHFNLTATPTEELYLKKFFAKTFNFEEDTLKLVVHLQRPGQYLALHIDKAKHKEFNDIYPIEDQYGRYLIFFDDWQMGQFFQMGTNFVKWSAGDVYTWSGRDVPHASANIGYEPRYVFMITGKIKKSSQ
jgi:hypothetical protein